MASSEQQIVRRLRALIFSIVGLCIAAAIIDRGEISFFSICFLLPGAWTYLNPRWPSIVIWIMWSSAIGMLAFILAIGGKPGLVEGPAHVLLLIAACLLFFAVPLVRRMHEAPPVMRGRSRIPEARIHRRDAR
jgi:hypothetical protein